MPDPGLPNSKSYTIISGLRNEAQVKEETYSLTRTYLSRDTIKDILIHGQWMVEVDLMR